MSSSLHFVLLRRSLAVWLAVFIAVMGAVAPTLSHALAFERAGASSAIEICTSAGPRWVAAHLPTDSPGGQESLPTLDHCPFCLLNTDRAAPPPRVLVHLFAVQGEPEAPTVRQAFFFGTRLAFAPPSRGPPPLI